MELILLAALAYGVYRGTQDMKKAVKGRYKKVLGSLQANRGGASPAPLAAKAGAVVATGLFGGVTAVKGFAAGWKQGWPEGKERGRDWWERRQQTVDPDMCSVCQDYPVETGDRCKQCSELKYDVNDKTLCRDCHVHRIAVGDVCDGCARIRNEEDEQIATADQVGKRPAQREQELVAKYGPDAKCDRCGLNRPTADGLCRSCRAGVTGTKPQLHLVNPRTDNTKEDPVAIDTVTGGEVYTLEEVRAEAETIKKEAAADLEDAQADSQRACEDNTRIEMFAASLRTSQYGDYAIQHVESMSESSASRKQAADQRAAAAESRLAQVEAFLNALETPEGLRA